MTKAEMIQQCKAGDKKAMDELYSAYSKRMLGIIRKYISDEETARDILHDGFVIIFTHISEIKDCNKAEYWMGTIMKNLSIQYLSQLDIYSTLDGNSDDIADSSDIADLLSYDELDAIINKLPTGYKTIFRLSVLENKSHKEISKILGIAPGTSSSQLFHAKELLKKLIREYRAWIYGLLILAAALMLVLLNKRETTSDHKELAIALPALPDAPESVKTQTHTTIINLNTLKPQASNDSIKAESGTSKKDIDESPTTTTDSATQAITTSPAIPDMGLRNHSAYNLTHIPSTGSKWRIAIAYSTYGNARNRFSTTLTNVGTGGIGSSSGNTIETDYKFEMPLTFGINLECEINSKVSVSTGLNMTRTKCLIEYYSNGTYAERDLKTFYIGISAGCNYNVLNFNAASIYIPAKIGMDIPIDWHINTENPYLLQLPEVQTPTTQFYISGGLGLEYNINKNIGFYIEPALRYNINRSIEGQNKFDLFVPIGVKFSW